MKTLAIALAVAAVLLAQVAPSDAATPGRTASCLRGFATSVRTVKQSNPLIPGRHDFITAFFPGRWATAIMFVPSPAVARLMQRRWTIALRRSAKARGQDVSKVNKFYAKSNAYLEFAYNAPQKLVSRVISCVK